MEGHLRHLTASAVIRRLTLFAKLLSAQDLSLKAILSSAIRCSGMFGDANPVGSTFSKLQEGFPSDQLQWRQQQILCFIGCARFGHHRACMSPKTIVVLACSTASCWYGRANLFKPRHPISMASNIIVQCDKTLDKYHTGLFDSLLSSCYLKQLAVPKDQHLFMSSK